jgi:hypothetical protein
MQPARVANDTTLTASRWDSTVVRAHHCKARGTPAALRPCASLCRHSEPTYVPAKLRYPPRRNTSTTTPPAPSWLHTRTATGIMPMEGVWHIARRPRWMRQPCTRRSPRLSPSRPVSHVPSPWDSARALRYYLLASNRLTVGRHDTLPLCRAAYAALHLDSRPAERREESSGHTERRDQGPSYRTAPQRNAFAAPALTTPR